MTFDIILDGEKVGTYDNGKVETSNAVVQSLVDDGATGKDGGARGKDGEIHYDLLRTVKQDDKDFLPFFVDSLLRSGFEVPVRVLVGLAGG